MTETINIRPTDPKADISDPSHGGARLPWVEEGVPRIYDAYWAGHIMRGDIEIVEPSAASAEPSAEPSADNTGA
ncbi:hypothetical protein GJ654_18790 [Rhodoblastus acidophilus]|uniref:Uncharacterized protein n=1 Tax=Rhodoblastus acidophilus TaxID=1074 RepID=A0A6N8DV47_RHOAC|nr:hypothetical protein [Rhodoblastus acidophilus]MCW2276376.1 hypothetical protein [Rhodoblastus acidophilus]MTV33031.1 hypothetical protein [Rhodoblastus acidophilus]